MEKKSQCDKLYELLKSGEAYRTDAIQELVYGGDHLGLARVGARIFDCKKKYGVEIEGWKDKENPTLYWYQLMKPPRPQISQETPPITIESTFQMPD